MCVTSCVERSIIGTQRTDFTEPRVWDDSACFPQSEILTSYAWTTPTRPQPSASHLTVIRKR